MGRSDFDYDRFSFAGHRSQVTGHRSQVTGHRSQVAGHIKIKKAISNTGDHYPGFPRGFMQEMFHCIILLKNF